MGRIKTARIKRAANTTIKSFKDKLTTNFEANKKLVDELAVVPSKKIRNIVAGYITRLMKMSIIEEKILRGELPSKKPRRQESFTERRGDREFSRERRGPRESRDRRR